MTFHLASLARIAAGAAFAAVAVAVPITTQIASANTGKCICEVSKDAIQRMIIQTSLENDVPPELALAVARIESAFSAIAVSEKGARGVMQIMPATARGEFGVGADQLWDTGTNVTIGVRYLRNLYERYGWRWDAALSHYNGGTLRGTPGSAEPHRYTARYVGDVLAARDAYMRDGEIQALIMDLRAEKLVLAGAPGGRQPALATPPPPKAPAVLRASGESWLSPSEQMDAEIAAFVARVRRSSGGF